MSWDDWKPRKGVFESEKDYQIRDGEWKNREINRSRTFSQETGGSGSRTDGIGIEAGCGCILIILLLCSSLLCGAVAVVYFFPLATFTSLIFTGLFYLWPCRWWFNLCRKVNGKMKFFIWELSDNSLSVLVDRLQGKTEGTLDAEIKLMLQDCTGNIFKSETGIVQLFAAVFYCTLRFVIYAIDLSVGIYLTLLSITLALMPICIYLIAVLLIFNAFD